MCSGATHKMSHLVACRVFLGIFEASFGAGAYVTQGLLNFVCVLTTAPQTILSLSVLPTT